MSTTTLTPGEIEYNLIQFSGTESYYQFHSGILLTDGTKYLAEVCRCYWLFDVIASYQHDPRISSVDLQCWTLKQDAEGWVVFCTEGEEEWLVSQRIEYSDFPLTEVEIWFANSIAYLPSEH